MLDNEIEEKMETFISQLDSQIKFNQEIIKK